jgi:hypothetical protein
MQLLGVRIAQNWGFIPAEKVADLPEKYPSGFGPVLGSWTRFYPSHSGQKMLGAQKNVAYSREDAQNWRFGAKFLARDIRLVHSQCVMRSADFESPSILIPTLLVTTVGKNSLNLAGVTAKPRVPLNFMFLSGLRK